MQTLRYLEVPCGAHLIAEGSETLNEYEAFLKAQSAGYTSACRGEAPGMITLRRHFYRCAACCKPFPAPAGPPAEEAEPEAFPSFFDWALQGAIPGTNAFADTFCFREPPDVHREVCCPHCGKKAKAAKDGAWYCVASSAEQIAVIQSVTLTDRFKLLPISMPWGEDVRFPLKLNLSFFYNTRRTRFCVCDREGETLWDEDITEHILPLRGFLMERHISSHTQLRQVLFRAFEKLHAGGLPFDEDEIDLETLVLLNRFQGFPRNFFDAIPFAGGSKRIESSFSGIAGRLGRYRDTPELYAELGLPAKKAVRRTFFKTPALFFYAREIKELPFRNGDVLLQILRAPEVFLFLALLKTLPGMMGFLRAVVAQKGDAAAWQWIRRRIESLPFVAAAYLLLPEGKREDILHGASSRSAPGLLFPDGVAFNYPFAREYAAKIPNSRIGEYVFRELKTIADYRAAGDELNNCLGTYTRSRVIGVKKAQRYVAAIEISGDAVVLASLSGNEAIQNDVEIYAAFLRWAEQNRLSVAMP